MLRTQLAPKKTNKCFMFIKHPIPGTFANNSSIENIVEE